MWLVRMDISHFRDIWTHEDFRWNSHLPYFYNIVVLFEATRIHNHENIWIMSNMINWWITFFFTSYNRKWKQQKERFSRFKYIPIIRNQQKIFRPSKDCENFRNVIFSPWLSFISVISVITITNYYMICMILRRTLANNLLNFVTIQHN